VIIKINGDKVDRNLGMLDSASGKSTVVREGKTLDLTLVPVPDPWTDWPGGDAEAAWKELITAMEPSSGSLAGCGDWVVWSQQSVLADFQLRKIKFTYSEWPKSTKNRQVQLQEHPDSQSGVGGPGGQGEVRIRCLG